MQTCLCDIVLMLIVVHSNDLLYAIMVVLHLLLYFSVSAHLYNGFVIMSINRHDFINWHGFLVTFYHCKHVNR